MAELVFFVGKGGVGKTTVSSAYAVRKALESPKQRVLLISTDPAHSLSDIFETKIGDATTPISLGSRARLSTWEINSERLFRSFIDEHKDELIRAVERGSLFTGEEVSSLLDTALPGMSEMGALLAIQKASTSKKYSTIVADTAPFGHTLRLFGLPEQFERLLNFLELAAERDQVLANHFGGQIGKPGAGFVDKWRKDLADTKKAFAAAQLFLVTTAEPFALNESVRSVRTLQDVDSAPKLSGIVLNRTVRKPSERCAICRAKVQAGKHAQSFLRKTYKRVPLYVGEDPGFPIQGPAQLNQFADAIFARKRARWHMARVPASQRVPQGTPVEWPLIDTPLTFVLGKGGVGKTTVSAALGFHARQRSDDEVEICSVDPAPSLDDVFQAEIAGEPVPVLGDRGFRASELDSIALYRNWIDEIRNEIDSATAVKNSGVRVDLSYDRQLFSQLLEIVPPGLDEVLAIFRVMELTQSGPRKVIIDMAPTGHALELLRTPERILVWSRLLLKSLASRRKLALAREAAVKIAELEVRARELSRALASTEVAVYVVMLPEALPDRETERLLHELHTLRIAPKAVFVNRVVLPDDARDCKHCVLAAAGRSAVLQGLQQRLGAKTVYVLPDLGRGPAGKRGLREITKRIWQLS